ncbi:hypothetical protein CF392_10620 [Tamilnaduibacter salinus]|uniref:Transcriptional regulator, AbiEi antitoxin, Type IV TA system n=1 Tax=Tamilnaduibacter salinus TaxID=1484056 RepID=A0A2A2I172_9GAMM|nr:DUF6088 family protein [Tamilnaduibacter salinus]PAV25479.1 hypothetical protein CF392_10620 [Tamilnaduibacter salinus]
MSTTEKTAEYVKRQQPGHVFTSRQVMIRVNKGSADVSKALNRLSRQKVVVKVERGLWYRPKKSRFGVIGASPEAIVRTLEGARGALIVPAGATALHELGASQQMSMRARYLTSKRIQNITVGKRTIEFVYSRVFENLAKSLSTLPKREQHLAARIWAAATHAGEEEAQAKQAIFRSAVNRLSEKGQERLLQAIPNKDRWIKELLEGSNEQAVPVHAQQ